MSDRLSASRKDALAALPVRTALPALRDALDGHGCAVLAAPPGTGKTTLVPLALAGLTGDGPTRRVIVAEPRRMAAKAAARRMAWLLGEEPGDRVGFTVRGERKVSPRTLVEVVTTGVLLQRLQRDQELPGADTVLLDECHERHLDADTAMAFLLDVRAALRPDLRIVAASATTDADAWSRLLDGAPVIRAEGRAHPVDLSYAPPPRGIRPPHGMRVDPALLDHIAATVRTALRDHDGDILCFLPGTGEIARVAGLLGGDHGLHADVLQLHGQAPAAVQESVLRGGDGTRRRIVLTTSVAESSLTVPGVRIVVDSGLAREPRTDHARGLGSLTTVRASHATAAQRLGRAGREAPGHAYRCWNQADDAGRPRYPSPEIAIADLTQFALQAAAWGDPEATGLALLDPPPAGALAAARDVLTAIGATRPDGRPTDHGTRMARVGLHPRLARALLDGAPRVGTRRAADIVALISEEPPRGYGDDLTTAWRTARHAHDAYAARWRAETRRLAAAAPDHPAGALTDDTAAGLVTALAFPERVARRRAAGSYLMASGTAADLTPGTRLGTPEWLAVAVADRPAGAPSARVRLATVIDEDTARTAAAPLLAAHDDVSWTDGDITAHHTVRLGAIELSTRPLASPDPGLLRAALLDGLRREGPALLRWSRDATTLRQRLAFLHRELGAPWPDVSDDALLDRADEWLAPELARARRRADLTRIDAGAALSRLLPWAGGEAARLGELAPERMEIPSGSRVRVSYDDDRPVLAAKLQELFGWTATPRIADGRVPLVVHLLSPAGRPAAVTSDLASFWREGYRAVRAELRGRYPKHPWPEDPSTATATRHTKARLSTSDRRSGP
ncbi:ATP-dependent helicase HrpB [Streptomyces sp. NPDC088354]|uniref:ATP-dependent helicase HrpB n=1 Tax=unclassified Streptomyces TaxID=2593676 RepID=UPI0029BDBFFE|nr:ATP-dependent helicase HrpB [Streptomyces sp. MI02-7b]MDX3074342.1 ATP-dependent helicase HrpB [Streptomyces sp. MI02-7b]